MARRHSECVENVGQIPSTLTFNCANYPGNNPYKLNQDCLLKLRELYDVGKDSKKARFSADRAHIVIIESVVLKKLRC